MLMKQPDDRSPHLFELEQLKEAYPEHAGEIDPLILRLCLMDSQRMFAETVNLHLAEPLEDVVVLHDLRLPLGDEVVEIDHLLINRSLQITLVDSGFMGAESVRVNRLGEVFIRSPESHEWVGVRAAFQELFHKATQLERILDRERWPKRLGMRLAHPVEVCVVLADEDEVIIEDPTRWEDRVMKITDFIRHYEKTKLKFTLTYGPLNVIQTGLNRVNKATMEKAAKLIADLHEFEPANYSERLGLELDLSESGMEQSRILKRHGLPDALDEFMPLDDLPRSLDEMAAGDEPEPAPEPLPGQDMPPAEEAPTPPKKTKRRGSRSGAGKAAEAKGAKATEAKSTQVAKPRKKPAKTKAASPVTKASPEESRKAPAEKAPDAKVDEGAPAAKAPAADEYLPSSRIAASLKMKTPQFLEMMEEQGYLARSAEGGLELTDKGRELGGQAKGKGGNRSFSWPKGVQNQLK
ncbi:nuclease-related domain-containing protein [Ectothiorhodospira marina]|uniref:Uncharacterized protein n=1 Tax=Ectothiorhodospira marina TaxID=1396821 RepID=A0A1H7MA95_9GAMM|nr:nuclease-related domain-containing protein [Ectothiorhodospira marina]SEL08084.1 hypothetical protein SAMN05444515_10920 [Ectothiorhodospira marina]